MKKQKTKSRGNSDTSASPNKKRTPTRFRKERLASGIVFVASGTLIFMVILLVLMKLDVVAPPFFLTSVFGGNGDSAEQTRSDTQSGIPELIAAQTEEYYHTLPVDPREALAELVVQESYVRELRVINSFGTEADIQKYTLTVNGDRLRLESDFKTVICDGTAVYVATETYRTKLDNSLFTPEYEVGMTSLADVRAAAEKGSVTYSGRVEDEKELLIISEDAESGVLTEYSVSLETGIVMTERSYINGELYRAVVTDSVDVFAQVSDDLFEIPEE